MTAPVLRLRPFRASLGAAAPWRKPLRDRGCCLAAFVEPAEASRRQRQWCSARSLPACLPARRAGIALCLFPISSRCLHRTGKPRAKPAPRHLGKITRYIYIYICFWIITFTNRNKEQRQVVLVEQPRGFVGAFWGSLVLLRAGVRYQQPGPAVGHGVGTGVRPTPRSCAGPSLPVSFPTSPPGACKMGCPLPAVPGRPPKLGREMAATTWLEEKSPAGILLQTRGKMLGLGGRSFASHALPWVARVW